MQACKYRSNRVTHPYESRVLASAPLLPELSTASTSSAVGSLGTSTITLGSFNLVANMAARFYLGINTILSPLDYPIRHSPLFQPVLILLPLDPEMPHLSLHHLLG